jgi:hypothetical protein
MGVAMTLQDLLQIVGGIGVVSSFIYAAIQVRRNTRAVRAATYQQLNQSIISIWEDVARSRELCELILRAGDDFLSLDRIDKARFRFSMMAYFKRYETAHFQHSVGILRETDWTAIRSDLTILFALPGVRSVWPLISNRSNEDFRAYIDALIEKIPMEVPVVLPAA